MDTNNITLLLINITLLIPRYTQLSKCVITAYKISAEKIIGIAKKRQ